MSELHAADYRGNNIDPTEDINTKIIELGMKVQDVLADEKVMIYATEGGVMERRSVKIRNDKDSLITVAQVKTPDNHYFSVTYRMPVTNEKYSTYDLKYVWGVEEPNQQKAEVHYALKDDPNTPKKMNHQSVDKFDTEDSHMIEEILDSVLKTQAESHG